VSRPGIRAGRQREQQFVVVATFQHVLEGYKVAPEIARIVEEDLADAKTLNVTKTREFFVNGKPMPSFGADQLKALVSDALAAAPR